MNSRNARTAYLFKKYYNRQASPDETNELFEILKNTPDDALILLMREEWDNINQDEAFFDADRSRELLDKVLPNAFHNDHAKRSRFTVTVRTFAAAAAILVFVGIGIYIFKANNSSQMPQLVKAAGLDDILPGGNKAVLTLSDGSRIILDSLHDGVIVKTSNFEITKSAAGEVAYHALSGDSQASGPAGLNIISTPRGGEYKVVLPDGSKVWLNAASSIKFPAVFSGAEREVELKGEAYFEITRNALMPFRVKSSRAEIEVLGTHFNVRSYADEQTMKTTLVEGSVKVRSGNAASVLKPGEQALLSGGELRTIQDFDVEEQIAWKNGLFQFKDASLNDVMKQASMWYDLEVTYDDGVPRKYITGKISRKVNASEFLNMLKYLGIKFKREGKNVHITN